MSVKELLDTVKGNSKYTEMFDLVYLYVFHIKNSCEPEVAFEHIGFPVELSYNKIAIITDSGADLFLRSNIKETADSEKFMRLYEKAESFFNETNIKEASDEIRKLIDSFIEHADLIVERMYVDIERRTSYRYVCDDNGRIYALQTLKQGGPKGWFLYSTNLEKGYVMNITEDQVKEILGKYYL